MMRLKKKGFTLVEIMIVVAILGLLAAIAIPNFIKARSVTATKIGAINCELIKRAAYQYCVTVEANPSSKTYTWTDITPYLEGEAKPAGGTYTLGATVSADVTWAE